MTKKEGRLALRPKVLSAEFQPFSRNKTSLKRLMTRTFQAWLPVDTQSFSKNQLITCYKSHFYPVLLKNEPELRSKTLAIFRWLKCKKRQNLLKKYYLHQVKTSLKTRKQKLSQNHRTTKIKTSMKHHVNLGKINREMDILGRLAVKKRLKMSPQTIL